MKRRVVEKINKEPVISNQLSSKLNLQEVVTTNGSIITAYGKHRVCVENYKNIIEYSDGRVRIQTKDGRVHIVGSNLSLAYYREDALCVVGEVLKIEYLS